MKKYMGNYTNEAAKALKGSERIICRVTDDGAIYVTNGFIAYKMNPPEYAAIVQPVTCCEAGNYTMQNGEKAADTTPKPVSFSATLPTMKHWRRQSPPPFTQTNPANIPIATKWKRPRQAATSPPVFHTTASIIISVRSATISRSSAGAVYPTTSSAAHTPSPAAPMTSSKSSTA